MRSPLLPLRRSLVPQLPHHPPIEARVNHAQDNAGTMVNSDRDELRTRTVNVIKGFLVYVFE